MVLECEHRKFVLVELGPLISQSEAEECEILYEALFILLQECLASGTTEIHIEDEVEIFAEAKIWEIYLIQTGSSLEYEITVFLSELDEDNSQEKIFLELELEKTITIHTP